MRRVILAVVLMLVVVGVSIYSNQRLDLLMEELSNHVLQTDELVRVENDAEALAVFSESYGLWIDHQSMLGAIVHHDEIDEIENIYLRALQYMKNQDDGEYFVESAQLYDMLQHLVDYTRFKVSNVF